MLFFCCCLFDALQIGLQRDAQQPDLLLLRLPRDPRFVHQAAMDLWIHLVLRQRFFYHFGKLTRLLCTLYHRHHRHITFLSLFNSPKQVTVASSATLAAIALDR